jgi:hypothetical protein
VGGQELAHRLIVVDDEDGTSVADGFGGVRWAAEYVGGTDVARTGRTTPDSRHIGVRI